MRPFLEALAQSNPPQSGGGGGRDTSAVVMWAGVLMGVVLVGFMVMMALRKRMLGAETIDHGGGFMDSLREARDSGQMSQEEYDAARKAMTARLTGARPANVKSPQGPRSG